MSERLKTFFKKFNSPIAAYIKSLKIREEPRQIETFTPEERQRFLDAILDYGARARANITIFPILGLRR